VDLTGFGAENPLLAGSNGMLYSIGMTLRFSRECGGAAGALFLCASTPSGSLCFGDSGSGLTIPGSPATLTGVADTVELTSGKPCLQGALGGFANVAAPEIRDFIEGGEEPPRAPQGGGVVIRGVPTAGKSLSCEHGSWSNDPVFSYAFVDSADNEILQQGSSPTYALSGADVGRAIFCAVQAANAGGTGVARTMALSPVRPAPVPAPPQPPGSGPGAPPRSEQRAGGSGSAAGGGVLGTTNASVGAARIAALLGQELTPPGKAATISALLKTGGFTVTFTALAAGTAVVYWYQIPLGARLAAKSRAKPILLATGQMTFPAAVTRKFKVELTAAGRRLLKHARSLKVTAKGTFTPAGRTPVVATKVIALKR